ncbi:MAG TPA: nuclear transport factor 2 family protein [Acidimicrobiia bacterium]|jgi:ketosteroid isomerase-like protein|nr:nuclear transport factor 2 family protein [Acidimicrobiia bacterium]
MSEINAVRTLFLRRVDAWLASDLEEYMDCWADDMVIEVPTDRIVGKDRYRKVVRAGFAWAQPLTFDIHHLAFEDGASVVALADWTIRVRRREDRVVIAWRGLSVCAFHEIGKITWWREHHLAPPAPLDA